jgi:DNA-binding transcriptional MerR regulator
MTVEIHDAVDPRYHYRMKDLCELTGLGRQAIHFYIQRGLLPPGHKTGRNMAYYGEEHVERLHLIKKLQHERFLPLKAIARSSTIATAFTEDSARSCSAKQRLGRGALGSSPTEVPVAQLLERLGLPRERLRSHGRARAPRVPARRAGRQVIASDDVWLLEAYAAAQRPASWKELGFGVDDLVLYDEVVQQLFQREAQMLASRIPQIAPGAGRGDDRARAACRANDRRRSTSIEDSCFLASLG